MVINPTKITIATGVLIREIMDDLMKALEEKIQGLEIQVIGIENDFFGENITVSGLLTGQDIIGQLQPIDLGKKLYLPDNILRSGEAVLLDNVTLEDLKEAIKVPLELVNYFGDTFIDIIIKDLQSWR
jgi:NifB/MoaA-like Fe-S oxidoreductase